jgi:dCMP deaminase
MPHCEENNHGWGPEFRHDSEDMGCRNSTHAEANAISFAARQGISTDGSELYVGMSPCRSCSFLIIAAGIVTVVYGEEYRDRSGVDLLEQAGIDAFLRFKPE